MSLRTKLAVICITLARLAAGGFAAGADGALAGQSWCVRVKRIEVPLSQSREIAEVGCADDGRSLFALTKAPFDFNFNSEVLEKNGLKLFGPSGSVAPVLHETKYFCWSASLSADGKKLAVDYEVLEPDNDSKRVVRRAVVFDTASGNKLHEIEVPFGACPLVFSPTNPDIAAYYDLHSGFIQHSLSDDVATLHRFDPGWPLPVLTERGWLIAIDKTGRCLIWDSSGRKRQTFSSSKLKEAVPLGMSGDHSQAVFCDWSASETSVSVWDVTRGQCVSQRQLSVGPTHFLPMFLPANGQVAVWTETEKEPRIQFLEVPSLKTTRSISAAACTAIAFSPSGEYMVLARREGAVDLFRLQW